jgi:hypothetical protein
MMVVGHETNLGVRNTMMSLEITENIIIKGLLALLGSWRWGPYGGLEDLTYGKISMILDYLWRYPPYS